MAGNIETKRKVCYFSQKFRNCKYGVNCKYIHPQVVRDSRPNKEKICFQFQKFGNCKYNSNCRFIHKLPQRPKRNYRRGNFNEVNSVPDNHTVNRNSMQYPFLDEMRTLVGVLKDMIHRQVQLFPTGHQPGFSAGQHRMGSSSSSNFSGCTNVASITVPRVAVCRTLGGRNVGKSPRTLPCTMLI